MRALLDTSIFLWMAGSPERLNSKATALVTAPDADLWLSVVSVWEIVIKVGIGKLDLGSSPAEFIPQIQTAYNVRSLEISQPHALALHDLPPNSHRDPFDRMLITQAWAEDLVLLTSDKTVISLAKNAAVNVLWAGR